MVRDVLRTGLGAALVVSIMFIGSLGMWVGTPLLWLWLGSQVEGATNSVGAAISAGFVGAAVTISAVAALLAKLSDTYRRNCRARGRGDPGHGVLEGVLVISAGVTVVAFGVWFLLFSGANPAP